MFLKKNRLYVLFTYYLNLDVRNLKTTLDNHDKHFGNKVRRPLISIFLLPCLLELLESERRQDGWADKTKQTFCFLYNP